MTDINLINSLVSILCFSLLQIPKSIVVIVFIAVVLSTFYLLFMLFIQYTKDLRSSNLEKLKKTLYDDYLGIHYITIVSKINSTKSNKILYDKTTKVDGFEYMFVIEDYQRTVKLFQFLNDECSGFYIQSYAEKYSPPYWVYMNEYIKEFEEKRKGIDLRSDRLLLTFFSMQKFFEPLSNSFYSFKDNTSEMFKNYFKIREDRYLSVNIDYPEIFPRSKYPVMFYLCSTDLKNMKDFKVFVNSIYLEILHNYIVDIYALNKHLKRTI
jgi:hypothetical protein